MADEQGVQASYSDPAGKKVRVLEVTTTINGVATTVEMQVISIADKAGNVIDDFAGYRFQVAMLAELQQIRALLGVAYGQASFTFPINQ